MALHQNSLDRHALHAASLSFTFQDAPFHFEKEIPEDFKRLIQFLQIYNQKFLAFLLKDE